jgi:hypothetical protein
LFFVIADNDQGSSKNDAIAVKISQRYMGMEQAAIETTFVLANNLVCRSKGKALRSQ